MLVHGDATCAPVWRRVAEGLVQRGVRVIVIGRSFCSSLILFLWLG